MDLEGFFFKRCSIGRLRNQRLRGKFQNDLAGKDRGKKHRRQRGIMSWLNGSWSELVRISDAIEQKWWEKLQPNSKGVYRLVALDEQASKPIPLNRVCGTDETGTLYIGASDHPLLSRLASLVKTHRADYTSKPHRQLSRVLADRFPENRLAITWEYANAPWQREAELLMAYEAEFGELPPNNGQRSVIDNALGK
jgi:predicted GIY-YIG superfamily endonuclease